MRDQSGENHGKSEKGQFSKLGVWQQNDSKTSLWFKKKTIVLLASKN